MAHPVWSESGAPGDLVRAEAARYDGALPFPHIVFEDFLPRPLADAMEAEFPREGDARWTSKGGRLYTSGNVAAKYELTEAAVMGPVTRQAIARMQAAPFVGYLEQITGLDGLMADPTLTGGGLNLVATGGLLDIHADYNWSNALGAYRVLNLLVYFNRGWRASDGGCLELWPEDMAGDPVTVVPAFNTAALFTTHSRSFHGYKPIVEPTGRARLSLNLYYYRREPLPGTRREPHKTLWKGVYRRADEGPRPGV